MGFLDKVSKALKEDSEEEPAETPSEEPEESPGNEVLDSETFDINFREIFGTLKDIEKNKYTYFLLLLPALIGAFWIRTRNLAILQSRYLLGLDPYYYLRVARTIVEQGGLPAWDYMRLAPMGWGIGVDLFTYILVYWYKLLHFISPSITQLQAHILYPPAFAVIGFFLFYLMARELFGNRAAIFSTAIFAVLPTYLYRTSAGFADHEAAAMPFMFISFWLFVKLLKAKKSKQCFIYSILSAIFAAGMGFTWGAFPMLTIPISAFMILKTVSETINIHKIKYFTVWNVVFVLPFFITKGLPAIKNISILLALSATALFYIYWFIKKVRFEFKYKIKGLVSLAVLGVGGLAVNAYTKIVDVNMFITNVLSPAEATGRVAKTISEIIGSTHFWSNFRWPLAMAVAGLVIIIFLMQKDSKLRYITTGLGAILLSYWAFVSITSRTSLILYILFSALAFTMIYSSLIKEEASALFLLLIMASINIYLGSTAARFLFTLSPFIALLAGFGIVKVSEELWKHKGNELKVLSLAIIIIFAYMTVSSGYASAQSVSYSGSGLVGQWETSMNWIKYNTPEDAIITHWWDYGYWTQTVAERPSTHDGGTHMEDTLQLLGRYAMTGTDDKDVLTYLNTHNVSYLLYSQEEIGKYHAFSFIGSESNENLDRASTIGIFSLAKQEETRTGERLLYQGTWMLDDDIIIGRQVIPEGSSAVVGISIIKEGNAIKNPQAIIYSNGQQYTTDISCMVSDGQRVELDVDTPLTSCITFIPHIQNNMANELGGIIFTSSKVKDGMFARLYLFNQTVSGFDEVYNDGVPLALYEGRPIGPIRIWEINYPAGTETRPAWLI